jgi:hypothetical protein
MGFMLDSGPPRNNMMKWSVIIQDGNYDIDFLRDLAFAATRKFAPPERWGYREENRAKD